MPIHNDEEYLPYSIYSILWQTFKPDKIVFVLDNCTDDSERIVRRMMSLDGIKYMILIKRGGSWANPIAENLEYGRLMVDSDYIVVVDADVVLERTFFEKIFSNTGYDVGILSGDILSIWGSLFGKIYYAWEKICRHILTFEKYVRGCVMVFRRELLVDGFKDVYAFDTYMKLRCRLMGYKDRFVMDAKGFHIRRYSFRKIISNQVKSGIARAYHKQSFMKVLVHSLFRVRPLVIAGYLKYRLRR
jgi:glycosyltransferase involved in cell wall biosynthesis